MAILLRNKPTDSDKYKVTDLALLGVTYVESRNQTTVNVLGTDSNHDAINIGDYIIPMRLATSASPGWSSKDILDPREEFKILNKSIVGTTRTLTLNGNHTKNFPGNGSADVSPEGYYSSSAIDVSQIVRNRKYRIHTLGATNWPSFGRLYTAGSTAEQGKVLAIAGQTFTATASGSGGGETSDAANVNFSPSFYRADESANISGNSPLILGGLSNSDTIDVNGVYDKIRPYYYVNRNSEQIVLQLRGGSDDGGVGTGRWTIWNPFSGNIYFEDANASSKIGTTEGERFDSPDMRPISDGGGGPNNILRPRIGSSIGNSPAIQWLDRTVSVSADNQYTTGVSTDAGKVLEVCHISSSLGTNRPLSNQDLDGNFISLESNKLAADGSQPVQGNLTVRGDLSADNLDVTNLITVGGAVPYSNNTGLVLGTKDLEVNNIRLSGVINDDALFRKYGIVGFPHSFLADYNRKQHAIEPCVILYFKNVEGFTNANTITAYSNSKSGKIRRVNKEYGYIMVSNTNSIDNWLVGDLINGLPAAGPITRVLEPTEYILPKQNIRVFGLQQSNTPLQSSFGYSDISLAEQPAKPSAPTVNPKFIKPGSVTYSYKVAVMNSRTGKISQLSDASQNVLGAPALKEWNKTNYVQLTGLSRPTNNDFKILVYRSQTGDTIYSLVDIWDNNDLGEGNYTSLSKNDYGGYNKAGWSVQHNESNNFVFEESYGMTYVPVTETQTTASAGSSASKDFISQPGNFRKYSKGYLDTQVDSVGVTSSTSSSPAFFRISETQLCSGGLSGSISDSPNIDLNLINLPNSGNALNGTAYGKENEIEFFVDSARMVESPNGNIIGGIQKWIMDSASNGKRSIRLPGGVYHSRLLTIPNDFSISGESDRNTTLKTLPWLNDEFNTRTPFGGFLTENKGTSDGAYDDNGTTKRAKQYIEYFKEYNDGAMGTGTDGDLNRFDTKAINSTQLDVNSGIFSGVYAGKKAYAKVLLEFDGKSNVSVADIKLDGNVINNVVTPMDTTGKSNYGMSVQKASNITLKNITIANTVLSGLYAEEANDIVIEGSSIKNGGTRLEQSAFATGLYAPGSEKLRATSNLIENFSNSNDLTSNVNSTMTGNIIRDTGSGILAYATSNFIHEGNLILGPADEYIPVVDTLNSEYDQVNVNLINESGASYSSFSSDFITFLRDDSPLNMAPNTSSSSGVALTSSIRTLAQLGTQSYFLPDIINGTNKFNYTFGKTTNTSGYAITTNIDGYSATEASLAGGNVRVHLSSAKVEELAKTVTNGGAGASYGDLVNTYDNIGNRPNGESIIGLAYDIIGTEYLYLGENDDKIAWHGIAIDLTSGQQKLLLVVDTNRQGLLAPSDKIIFTLGYPSAKVGNAGDLQFLTAAGEQDMNGNPVFLGLPVLSKVVGTQFTNIILDISDTALGSAGATIRSGLTSIGSIANPTMLSDLNPPANVIQAAGCLVGIQNKFSIVKGRLII